MNPDGFVELLGRERACAILRTDDQRRAADAMAAAVRGGFRVIEFTLSIPGVYDLIRDFAARDGVVVGAGTVMDAEQAGLAVAAGAEFLVSPVVEPSVIQAAADLGVACMPGTHTPTEMLLAHRSGAQLCKLFPRPRGGPAWVKAVLGPLPFLKIVPTHGVDHLDAGAWIAAGAHAVGFVATLFEPGMIAAGAWDAVEARARDCLEAARPGS